MTETVFFTTKLGELLTIAPSDVLVIHWAGRGGCRGATATHTTEAVVDLLPANDGRWVAELTGGSYRDGSPTRLLPLTTTAGAYTRQIVGSIPVGRIVGAMMAAAGAYRAPVTVS